MVELWGIIYIVWKTSSPLECMCFFIRTCVTNHVLLVLQRTIFCKKCLHKQFFLKMVELWGINIYIVWKTTVVPLSVCRAFLIRTCICVTNHVLLVLQRTIFCKKCLHKQFFLKMVELWGINIYIVWKTTVVPLSVCRAFLVRTCICVTNHVLLLLHRTIFCKKCLHKQFFLKMVELWGINIYIVWKTTVVPLSVCRAFLIRTCICVTNHVLLVLQRTIFCKKCLHKQFFLKMVELWGINIYIVWKTTVVPLSVCRAFLVRTCICVTNHVLLLLHRTIFCKKCLHKQFFLKMVELWGINIYIVWKTTVVPLSVCRAFLVRTCICVTNHVLLLLHRTIFCKKCLHKQFFLKMVELWGINIYIVWKTTVVPLSVCRAFLIRTCICVTNHVLLVLQRTIFCKKCLHKQFFLKMVELWGINIYIVWKTTVVPLSVCRAFLVRTCICVTNHVLLLLHRTIFCKKCLHKQFFLKMVELWGINIYIVWKTTVVPLSVCRAFLIRT